MLEILLKPIKIKHHPILMGLLSFFAVTIALFLSMKIFPNSSSILIITFTFHISITSTHTIHTISLGAY